MTVKILFPTLSEGLAAGPFSAWLGTLSPLLSSLPHADIWCWQTPPIPKQSILLRWVEQFIPLSYCSMLSADAGTYDYICYSQGMSTLQTFVNTNYISLPLPQLVYCLCALGSLHPIWVYSAEVLVSMHSAVHHGRSPCPVHCLMGSFGNAW